MEGAVAEDDLQPPPASSTPVATRATDARTSARAGTGAWIAMGLTAVVAVVVLRPLLLWLVDTWLYNPYYSHGLLVLPIAAFVAYKRRARFREAPRTGSAYGYAWIAFAGLVFVLGRVMASNYMQGWSLLPLLVGAILVTHGEHRARTLVWPIAFTALVIPVPLLETAFGPLQLLATRGATGLANVFGLHASYTTNTILVDGMAFGVVPMCAGLSSTLSLVAVTAVALLVWPVKLMPRLAVFALVVPIALLANAGRIALTMLVATRTDQATAVRFHDGAGGVLLYVVALGCIGAAVWTARRLDAPKAKEAGRRA